MPKTPPTSQVIISTHRLSLEATPTLEDDGGAEVAVYLDRAGLDCLMAALRALAEQRTDQVHLMSDVWGLGPLTVERWRPQGWTAHHLKIYLRPDAERLREVAFVPM